MNSNWWKHLDGKIGNEIKNEIRDLLNSKQFYIFVENHVQDGPYGKITYNCYGDINTNTLFATMKLNNRLFYAKIKSGLINPPMKDRLFGFDQMDAQSFNWMTDILCHVYIEGKTEDEVMKIWDEEWNKYIKQKSI